MTESTHVSLSKTFVLKFHWIDNFLLSLKDNLKSLNQKFLLQFSSNISYFSNEERTRFFACILVSEWCLPMLSSLVEKVDKTLNGFNLPLYYEHPSMHLSCLWKLEEFTSEEKTQISSKVEKLFETHREVLSLSVDRISCKSGNKLFEISLH